MQENMFKIWLLGFKAGHLDAFFGQDRHDLQYRLFHVPALDRQRLLVKHAEAHAGQRIEAAPSLIGKMRYA